MLKRIARYFFIVFGLVVLWASTWQPAMEYISDARSKDTWWGIYQRVNGDLVSITYLDNIEKLRSIADYTVTRPEYNGPRKTELYLYADSYGWHINDTAFAALSGFHFTDKYFGGTYQLDTAKRNILILLFTEREIQEYMDTSIFNTFHSASEKPAEIAAAPVAQHSSIDLSWISNPKMNTHIEYNLFNYQFLMPVFKEKAEFNYYVFKRASGSVALSDDGDFLFFGDAVNTNRMGSTYYTGLRPDHISKLVYNVNRIYDHYKQEGFREVYLSIIPNPSTVIQPAGYNQLIPLIQSSPDLRMKTIDMYSIFKQTPATWFRPGDTHWSNKGLRSWLGEVNSRLVAPDQTHSTKK